MYVTSVLVSLEGNFSKHDIDHETLTLLHLVFHVISTAMRFEPANAKLFHHEICTTTLCDTLRLLGCFTSDRVTALPDNNGDVFPANLYDYFYKVFVGNLLTVV